MAMHLLTYLSCHEPEFRSFYTVSFHKINDNNLVFSDFFSAVPGVLLAEYDPDCFRAFSELQIQMNIWLSDLFRL